VPLEASLLLCDVGEIAVPHSVFVPFWRIVFSKSETRHENFVIFGEFLPFLKIKNNLPRHFIGCHLTSTFIKRLWNSRHLRLINAEDPPQWTDLLEEFGRKTFVPDCSHNWMQYRLTLVSKWISIIWTSILTQCT